MAIDFDLLERQLSSPGTPAQEPKPAATTRTAIDFDSLERDLDRQAGRDAVQARSVDYGALSQIAADYPYFAPHEEGQDYSFWARGLAQGRQTPQPQIPVIRQEGLGGPGDVAGTPQPVNGFGELRAAPKRGLLSRLFVPEQRTLPSWDQSTTREKAEKILRGVAGIPTHLVGSLTGIVSEPAWAAYKASVGPDALGEYKDLTFAQAVDKASGSDPAMLEKIVGGAASFVAPAKLAEKGFARIAGGVIPKAASRVVEGAKAFGAAEAAIQASKGLAGAIDPSQADYGYEGALAVAEQAAMGAGFGGIEKTGLKWTAKKAAEAALLAGQTAAHGGSMEDIFTAAAIPVLFATPSLAGQFFAGLDSPKTIQFWKPPAGSSMTPEQFREWSHQQARTEARAAARRAMENPNDPEAQAQWQKVRAKYAGLSQEAGRREEEPRSGTAEPSQTKGPAKPVTGEKTEPQPIARPAEIDLDAIEQTLEKTGRVETKQTPAQQTQTPSKEEAKPPAATPVAKESIESEIDRARAELAEAGKTMVAGREYRIEHTGDRTGWVYVAPSDTPDIAIRKGGDPRGGGFSKEEAIAALIRDEIAGRPPAPPATVTPAAQPEPAPAKPEPTPAKPTPPIQVIESPATRWQRFVDSLTPEQRQRASSLLPKQPPRYVDAQIRAVREALAEAPPTQPTREPTKEDMAVGALPGMSQEVRETSAAEIRNWTQLPSAVINDEMVRLWPQWRDRIISLRQQIADLAQKGYEERTEEQDNQLGALQGEFDDLVGEFESQVSQPPTSGPVVSKQQSPQVTAKYAIEQGEEIARRATEQSGVPISYQPADGRFYRDDGAGPVRIEDFLRPSPEATPVDTATTKVVELKPEVQTHEEPTEQSVEELGGATRRNRPRRPATSEEAPTESAPASEEPGESQAVRPERPRTGGEVSGEGRRRGPIARRDLRSDSGDVDQPAGRRPTPRRPSDASGQLDYRITASDDIEAGGPKTKYRNNVAAVRLLKQIESEGRRATAAEQAVLVKYTGWGGLPQAFDAWNADWKRESAELREALTDEEYRAARASTPNAHYTSPQVVRAIWDGLVELGFQGGRINEPAIGTGMFYGLMPDEIAAASRLFGVELDNLSARIAGQLYQSATVENKGFQDVRYPDNFFDLFISNVPFDEQTRPTDPDMRKVHFALHDFYFAKALKKTRPGGIVAFITSKGTMDKGNSTVRKYLANQGDLIGAIRLPKTAFGKIANTEVVTDIILLQKRKAGDPTQGESWTNVVDYGQGDETFSINEYFTRHPDHILGKLSYAGSMYRANEMTVEDSGIDLGRVADLIGGWKPARDLYAERVQRDTQMHKPDYQKMAPENVRERAYVMEGGSVFQNVNGAMVPVAAGPAVRPRFAGMIRVRDLARTLIGLQLDPQAESAAVEKARKDLGKAYDVFVAQYDAFHTPYNRKLFFEDPDSPLLLALENYDSDTKTATKARIFTERTQFPVKEIDKADSPEDAVAVSMSERGRIDLEYIGALLGTERDAAGREIAGYAYENPESSQWEPAFLYLSGNVRKKLAAAEAAAKLDPKYQANVDALQKVQPEDIPATDISVRLGSPWIDADTYKGFLDHLTGRAHNAKFTKFEHDGSWVISGNATSGRWDTPDFSTSDLVTKTMNYKEATVWRTDDEGKRYVDKDATTIARVMQQKIKDEFERWIWSDADRAKRLARVYNDTFNHTVFPQWDGSYLRFPGQSTTPLAGGRLRPHQANAVARFLTGGNMLMAHAVGAGKTYAGITMAMEGRRIGQVKKAVFVVPNHKIDDWRVDWMKLYPSANILAATKDDFTPQKRKTLMNRIATGDWDGVIVPMTSFEKIPMSPDRVRDFFQDQIDELEMEIRALQAERGKENKNIVKRLEKAKSALEEKLKKQEATWKKDQGPYFDELGIDMMFVDESHAYKNLFFVTKMDRVSGLQVSQTQRSFDMYLKSQYLNETTRQRGIVYATGTPITNTIGEMFTLQRYLQPEAMREAGLQAFDFWAKTFGDTVTDVEVDPTGGGFRVNTRFARFTNLPELMQMFRSVTDIVTKKTMKIPLPKLKGGKPATIQTDPSPDVQDYIKGLVERAEAIRSGKVKPWEDNMLAVTNDGRHVALDPRLRIPGASDDPGSKVNRCVEEVHRIYQESAKDKALQVIWCDLSTPKKGQWSVYDDIKQKLIHKGIPKDQIAFIHDAADEKQQASLYLKANAGKIRVLLASTGKMGTGANIQQRLLAAHHLTAPWVPAEVEQRDGRIERQGNQFDEVQVYQYVTKGTFDAYMWQTLETKAKFIEQVMNGETTGRDVEDISKNSLTFAEVKALASGNPKILTAIKLDAEVKALQAEEKAHRADQFRIREEMTITLPMRVRAGEHDVADLKADAEKAIQAMEAAGEGIEITIGTTPYSKRKEAGEALMARLEGANKFLYADNETGRTLEIGSAYGFRLEARYHHGLGADTPSFWRLRIAGRMVHTADMGESPTGNITRIENAVAGIQDKYKQRAASLERDRKRLEELKDLADRPFAKADQLTAKRNQLTQLQQEIGLGRKDDQSQMIITEEQPKGRMSAEDIEDIEDIEDVEEGETLGSPGYPQYNEIDTGSIRVEQERQGDVGKPVAPRDIVDYVRRNFHVPVHGKATHRTKVRAGWFDPKAVGVRMIDQQQLGTAIHELGHYIDWHVEKRWSKKPPSSAIRKELLNLGKALYGNRTPPGGYKSEGWAEFLRLYLTGEEASQKAPELLKYFEGTFLKDRPELAGKIKVLRGMIDRWRQQGADDRIKAQINRKPIKGPLGERLTRLGRWLDTAFRTELAPLRRLSEEIQGIGRELRPSEDPFELGIAYSSKAPSMARHFVNVETTDVAGEHVGPSLRDAVSGIRRRDFKGFTRWLYAKEALQRWGEGKNPGISKADAEYVYNRDKTDAWEKAADAVTKWNRDVLDYLVEAGGFDPRVRDLLNRTLVYIPLFRAFAEGETRPLSEGTGRSVAQPGKPVKRMKGSGRQIMDPFESMIQQAEKFFSVAHKAMVAKSLARLADVPGMAGWIWKVPAPKQKVQFESERIKNQIKQIAVERLGLDPDEIPVDKGPWEDVITLWMNASQYYGKDNVVSLYVDGVKQWFEVHPDLYRAIEGLDVYRLPWFLAPLGMFKRTITLGATGLNPSFGLVRNFIRDGLTALVTGEHTRGGPLSSAVGAVKDVAGTESARRFKALGGEMAGQLLHDRIATQRLVKELGQGWMVRTVRHPIQALRELFGITELGPRIQEFEKAYRYASRKWGAGSRDAAIYAINAAQDVTVNFTRHGTIGKVLNELVAFFNASIQGPDKILRTFRRHPGRSFAVSLAGLTLPAILLWWLAVNDDDDWYGKLSDHEKANYLHFRIPGTKHIVRIPIPFELGYTFQALPVAVLDQVLREDPDQIKEVAKIAGERSNPVGWPSALGPLIEVLLTNKDYRGVPIESEAMRHKLPEDRVRPYTTNLMRYIGKKTSLSPVQLEHLVDSYSGGLYRRIMRTADVVSGKAKAVEISDVPVVGTLFVRQTDRPSEGLDKFYERLEQLDQKAGSKKASGGELYERHAYHVIQRQLAGIRRETEADDVTPGRKKELFGQMDDLVRRAAELTKGGPQAKELLEYLAQNTYAANDKPHKGQEQLVQALIDEYKRLKGHRPSPADINRARARVAQRNK